MARIRIDTERVREVGQQFLANGQEITEIRQRLEHSIDDLDTGAWDGRSRAKAEPLLGQVRIQSIDYANKLERLGRMLQHVADQFEREDSLASRDLGRLPWVDFDKNHSAKRKPNSIRPRTPSDKKIYELRDEIREAAYGAATPELIAAILQDEINRGDWLDFFENIVAQYFINPHEGIFEDIERGILNSFNEPIETVSLGIAQMNPETVYGLVENNYISKPPNWDEDKLDITLSWLADEKGAPKLVAAYLNQISDHWANGGYPVDTQMLATLYSHTAALGEPHADPGTNDRGDAIFNNFDHVSGIMQYTEGTL